MAYTMYTPLNVWLDPASVTDVVAYIQNYLSNNPIYSTIEIEALINAYLIAHPELISVQSVNGKTGTVVLSASDITTENDVTIESALASLSSQISSIAASVATNTNNITALTGRMLIAETDISNLKSNLDTITTTIRSQNIFDQANATIVSGKYLNYTNGNVGTNADYCYVDDYIPIKPNTSYCISTWNKSSYNFYGNYNAFAVFYDSNKQFISGLSGNVYNPFTTPSNCEFIRISMALSGWNSSFYMIEEGIVHSSNYVPYSKIDKIKLPSFVVDKKGNGEFATISDAVIAAQEGDVILVFPGVYEENVKSFGKKIHIIGMSRDACVIKDTSGNYETPPLEIGAGSIQNMSIIEVANGAGTSSQGAYAVHVESNNLFNEKLLIRNCYIYSDSSSAIGMGLRGGCSVRIEDCEIICAGARISAGAAPLYFHDADTQAYWGTANLYLHNNVLRNTASTLYSMLTINSIHAENTTYMHMMYNIFVRSKTPSLSQKFNTWNTSGNTDADGWNSLSHMYLEDDSFGNNLTELNYSE